MQRVWSHAVTLLLNLSLTPFDWRRWPGVAAMPGDGRAGRDGQRVSFRALLARTLGTARAWRAGRSRRRRTVRRPCGGVRRGDG